MYNIVGIIAHAFAAPGLMYHQLFSTRLTRKTLAFSKHVQAHEDAATWVDAYYNWVRPHKGLHLELQDDPTRKWILRTPAIAAGLTNHV